MGSARLINIRQAMEKEGLELLICRNPENVLYLTGYWPITGWSLAFLPLEGEPVLIVPVSELEYAKDGWVKDIRPYEGEGLNEVWNPYKVISKALEELKHHKYVKIGCELSFETVATNSIVGEVNYASVPTFKMLHKVFEAELVDASRIIVKLRSVKSEYEIEKMKLSAKLASLAIEKLLKNVSEGVKESTLASVVEATVYSEGVGFENKVKRARGFAFVMSGENTSKAWYPFNISTDRRIRRGDVILLELNVCADGYWVDITRTWVLGKPSSEQEAIYYTVLEAQEEVYRFEYDGVEASSVDEAARSLIARKGFSKFFPHRLGHGVGLRIHEAPTLHPTSRDILRRNTTHTVEPGVYTDKFGMRLEDVVIVQDRGVKNLFEKYKTLSLKTF
ncbi:aminopeptidase P family protein [Candidatus Bathyarchaeota archaeon]|nr:aminopeptidase P family protein [Candidatus Bathyarchaeota archaeon]MBS7613338.1 aminopeptidase P family protein [Candidatus Bathyarchaeota archaeon]MBS7617241.1 aminopeptidase P family protein [Candidatus Bathyarchaeota archaeon]